jgi:serine/threonine-protein kinase
VPGETLKTLIGGRPLNPRRALDLAIQLADALAEVHAQSLAHLDIKPDNVIVTPKGNAKLLDCGLAEWTSGGAARDRTAQAAAAAEPLAGATFVRTVPYMSPEQVRGGAADYRSDVFSLGAVIFEMLTGKPPHAAPTPNAVARQIVETSAPAPTAVNPALPREVDLIVGRCLAPGPDDRYESAATLAAELRSLAAILDVRSGTSEPPALVAAEPEPRSGVGLAIAGAILALAAGIVWLVTRT